MISAEHIIGGFIALAGILVGSFINALVWRIHKGIPIGGKERSQCTHCNHQLAWYDLVPIFSWLVLGARCRYCQKKISMQYPLVEISVGIFWLTSFWLINPSSVLEFIVLGFWLACVSIMFAMAVYDMRWMILPDRLVAIFVCLSAFVAGLRVDVGGGFLSILDPIFGVLFIAGLFYFLFQVSDGKWIGGGDVKLAVGIGLLLGLKGSVMALFVASLLGSILGLSAILILKRNRKDLIPFGPFLLLGTYIVFLIGEQIFSWYASYLF